MSKRITKVVEQPKDANLHVRCNAARSLVDIGPASSWRSRPSSKPEGEEVRRPRAKRESHAENARRLGTSVRRILAAG
jgi:hypothetical protein